MILIFTFIIISLHGMKVDTYIDDLHYSSQYYENNLLENELIFNKVDTTIIEYIYNTNDSLVSINSSNSIIEEKFLKSQRNILFANKYLEKLGVTIHFSNLLKNEVTDIAYILSSNEIMDTDTNNGEIRITINNINRKYKFEFSDLTYFFGTLTPELKRYELRIQENRLVSDIIETENETVTRTFIYSENNIEIVEYNCRNIKVIKKFTYKVLN